MSSSSQAPLPEPLSLPQRLALLEPDAYDEFGDEFGPRLCRYFRRHGLSDVDARDLAATCVTDIALKARKYRAEKGSFSSWVYAVARNAMLDFLEKAGRVSTAIKEMPTEVPVDRPDEAVVNAVRAALEELRASARTLVTRRAHNPAQTFKVLGKELGLKEGTARGQCLRAMNKLERRLKQQPAIQTWLRKGQR